MQIVFYSSLLLGAISFVSAVILFFVSKVFKVTGDPQIDDIVEVLPGANCGGCGYAGCRNFAEAVVRAGNLDGFSCPAGGTSVAESVAKLLGLNAVILEPKVAVVRCNGTLENASVKNYYDGAATCSFASSLFAGESNCPNGCIGLSDCVRTCVFNAIYLDESTKLPVVDDSLCVGCGACTRSCPRNLIELRFKGKERRIFVACRNCEKGAVAKKNCITACIGCGKCAKVCDFGAIILKNNLSYIDYNKCNLCGKCVSECPSSAIHEINFSSKPENIEQNSIFESINN